MASQLTDWTGEDVRLADVDHAIAQLRAATVSEGAQPSLRTSVMTHMAWVPEGWVEPARAALSGMAERHPSRTILLLPEPNAGAAEPPQRRVHLRARTQMDRRVLLGEALEQRPPVPDDAVEHRCRGGAIRRKLDLDAGAPRHVLEPRAPERPRVAEDGVEVERECLHERGR